MAKKILITVPLLIIILILLASATLFIGYDVARDVRYSDGELCTMDIYTPWGKDSGEAIGCVILIHGGSWSGGDKAEEELRARLIARSGYMAVAINYTLFTAEADDTFDIHTMLNDIEAAITAAKKYAEERGIAINKIATAGYSAGAHLSLLYAYSRHDTSPIDIAFTVSMAGPTEITPEIWGEDLTISIGNLLSTKHFDKNFIYTDEGKAILREISPTSYIAEGSAPTLILQGAKDTTVPPENAEALYAALSDASVNTEYIILPNSTHALIEDFFGFIGYHISLIEWCNEYFS
jgi:acetyl esterase/lipase